MALNLVYPSAASIKRIDADLAPKRYADRLGLQLFPVVSESTIKVRWVQRDNAYGLMAMRGIDGAAPRVQRTGENSFEYQAGVYGEHIPIGEMELLTRADALRPGSVIPVGDMVDEANTQLKQRMDDRKEANVWTLLGTGVLNIPLPGPSGPVVYKDQYTFQSFSPSTPWATAATSTPIEDMQVVQQKHLGHGVSFGADAKAYLNQFTANLLLNNTNASDFGGKRSQYGSTFNNVPAFNDYFRGQNLPQFEVYDEGYQLLPLSGPITNAATQFIKFIPDHTIIVVGKRPNNVPLGAWKQTLQAMQPGSAEAPGEYFFVKDYARGINAPVEVPPRIEVHRGFNGGLVVEFPSAFITMTV